MPSGEATRFEWSFFDDFHACVDAFVDEVLARRGRGERTPIVALVGSNPLRRQLQELLLRRGGGVWGVWLPTFRDLAAALGRPALLRRSLRPVPPLYQPALLARLLRERAVYFAPVGRYDGSPEALLATFTDLEEAGWSAWPLAAPGADKLGELAGLFDEYRRELTRDFFTPQDEINQATAAAARFAAHFGTGELHVVGVYDVNALQEKLLTAIARHATVRWWVPRVLAPPPFLKKAGLPPAEPWRPDPERLRIWSCPSETAEAETIVREARRLRRAGVAYHEMGVILRHPDLYADLFAETCRRAGVPYRLAGGQTPLEAPAWRAVLRLLGLIGSPLGRTEVMAFLAAVELPATDDGRETQPLWDRVSRLARIRKGDDWLQRLEQFAAGKASEEERRAARALSEAFAFLRAALDDLAAAADFRRATAALTRLIERFLKPDEHRAELLERLAELNTIDRAGLPFDAGYFRGRADELILSLKEEAGDEAGLAIVGWTAARGLRFRMVFVPGCVESQIPQPPRQDPFLLDGERLEICRRAGRPHALPITADRAVEEGRVFDLVCRVATERLALSFPRLDPASGKPRLPSHLLLGLAGRALGETLTYDDLPRRQPLVEVMPAGRFAPVDPASALDDDERDLGAMIELAKADPAAPIYYLRAARAASFERVWRRQQSRWAEKYVTRHEGLCESAAARAKLAAWAGGKDAWSVTELENYALCPRRFLLTQILALRSPDDPELVVSLPADRRGRLFHKVLEKAAADPARLTPPELDRLIADEYERLAAENLTGGGVLDEAERERLAAGIRALLSFAARQSEGYTVQSAERELTAEIAIGERTVALKGRLDRLDRDAEGGWRIVDYKTGKARRHFDGKPPKNDDFNAGCTLQVPLYLLMMLGAGPEPAAVRRAAYWFLKNKDGAIDPTAVEMTADFVARHGDELRQVIAGIVGGIGAGRFVPRSDLLKNDDNAYCRHCDFQVICDPRGRARLAAKPGEQYCPWLRLVGRIDE
ncbi:MAG: hypothetical protein GX444_14685 [Myxococcales bacterium]|nr:hypothetical protein [Myxococcales bacterium]